MNTSQRLKALDAEYDLILRKWQNEMERATDPDRQHKLHIVGNRAHMLYEEMREEILSGRPR